MATNDAPAVHRTVEVQAPTDQVWELLVDDDERAAWFGGPTTIEPVPGGAGAFTDPDGTVRRAVVDHVEPGRRLAWTWWPGDEDGTASRVDVVLQPTPGGTRVSVTEAPIATTAKALASAAPAGDRFPLLALETTCLVRVHAVAIA